MICITSHILDRAMQSSLYGLHTMSKLDSRYAILQHPRKPV